MKAIHNEADCLMKHLCSLVFTKVADLNRNKSCCFNSLLVNFIYFEPSSIYSWSIGQNLEHEFFCLGHLGCAGSKGKKVDLSFSEQLLRVVFSTFWGQKKNLNFFFKHFSNRIEKLHKIAFIIFFYFFWKSWKKLKK